MLLFVDKFGGDEVLSDSFKIEEIDGVVYKVQSKNICLSHGIDESKIGGNKSAEGGDDDEGADDATEKVLDIVHNHKLQEIPMTKKDYQKATKDYMKKLVADLSSEDKGHIINFFKKVTKGFDDYQLFSGENVDIGQVYEGNAMIVLAEFEGESETPCFYYFKHGLKEEKC